MKRAQSEHYSLGLLLDYLPAPNADEAIVRKLKPLARSLISGTMQHLRSHYYSADSSGV